jgi:hypothetical protein
MCYSQVAEWIGQRLAAPYRYKYSMTDNDLPLPRNQQPVNLQDRWEYSRAWCVVTDRWISSKV